MRQESITVFFSQQWKERIPGIPWFYRWGGPFAEPCGVRGYRQGVLIDGTGALFPRLLAAAENKQNQAECCEPESNPIHGDKGFI